MDERLGLRERKKLETRQALSWAALRLAVERGLENVLVEDIAASAGVSSRTFNNYFSSKAEAITSRHLDRGRQLADHVRRRPPGETVWESILEAALAQYAPNDRLPDPEWTAGVRLMTSEPALIGEFLRASSVIERELAEAIAERTRTNVAVDLYPRLVAASVGAAIEVATDRWLTADPPILLGPLVHDALTQVAAGLPDPQAG
ncbi:TetR family transcriptional regulator [Actinosynnema sp. NPDC047251]|uniref:Transcriptional regulator, TetR family n=1 Tax=Saccharothrix espanaensis (strain ATCC 51144 / DSM 44229 / JCM 9112 / NBRC 15066 / NRRL 15764) TaxID=1179773 RepID=K0JS09_SACES|nr:TetR family transcriptional regulator [Saccharothrix espanaensis]CCH30465.1 Transcriptional regulator, TetR family [Saccharothrix espanaensis DSM 44229]